MSNDGDAYLYRALLTDVPVLGEVMPPILDLTVAAGQVWNAATDDYDEAALAAVLAAPATSALWRSWRLDAEDATGASATRVYAIKADDPPAAIAAIRAHLAGTGRDDAILIGFAAGEPASPAGRAALVSSALLWALDSDEPIRTARVFDGDDPDTGLFFDPEHPRLANRERDAVLRFLDSGRTLAVTPQLLPDIVDPARGPVVPMTYRTDGAWVWTDTVTYYLREHGLAPDELLLEHARDAGYVAAEVGAVGRHRALACLFLPGDVEMADIGAS
jgi:hypothetical protein